MAAETGLPASSLNTCNYACTDTRKMHASRSAGTHAHLHVTHMRYASPNSNTVEAQ